MLGKTCYVFSDTSGKKGIANLQSSETLHAKLREAAQRINGLTKEREQLIKMGNKLRAELLKYKGTFSALYHYIQNQNILREM
jgi:predicted nuclease with TOPRIM domain